MVVALIQGGKMGTVASGTCVQSPGETSCITLCITSYTVRGRNASVEGDFSEMSSV